MIDFRLKTFLTLCKVLNYTKTAEILHITQPAVSQHIKYLESKYNVKLFNYSGKTLNLTESGELLYNFLLAMDSSSQRIKEKISKPNNKNLPITFGTTLTISEYTMNNLLPKLLLDYPKLNITMEVGNTKNLLNQLANGDIDFAILEGHFDKSQYETYFFSLESFIGVCSPLHKFANKNVDFEDILKERLILREKGSGTRNIFEQILYEHNFTMNAFKRIIQVGNMTVIKNLVCKNLGITFLYKEAVKKEIEEESLVQINLTDFQVNREFNFVYLKDSLHHNEYEKWLKYLISIK